MSDQVELGPNVQKLLMRFIAREAVPPGGGLADGAKFILDEEHRRKVMERAKKNMQTAFEAVRAAPDNPHGDDEEAIAGAILSMLAEKEARPLPTETGGRNSMTEATIEFAYQDKLALQIEYDEGLWIVHNGMTQGVNRDFTKAIIDFALHLEDYYESLVIEAEANTPLGERLQEHLRQLRFLYNPPTVKIMLAVEGGEHA